MLVLEAEAVDYEQRRRAGLVGLDHRFAAARITRHGIDGDRGVGWHEAGCHQGPQKCDAARGIAAGIGDALGRRNGRRLRGVHFGKTEDPAVAHAMGARGVEDTRGRRSQIIGQGYGVFRSVVGQAQHDDVHLFHEGLTGGWVLALVGIDRAHLDAGDLGQTLTNFDARGAGFTIDEDGGFGFGFARRGRFR